MKPIYDYDASRLGSKRHTVPLTQIEILPRTAHASGQRSQDPVPISAEVYERYRVSAAAPHTNSSRKHFSLRRYLLTWLRPIFPNHPTVKKSLAQAHDFVALCRHTAAERLPIIIRPQTYRVTVAITAYCNLRCIGCRYGRDFMPGHQLSLKMVKDLLDDASVMGVDTVRLYGGEPLLHPDLPAMVRHACEVGVKPFVTTNGILLRERVDELYSAGLRSMSIGFYGDSNFYDSYVQRSGRFEKLERGLSYVRERYGDSVSVQLNFLLMQPSCNKEAVWAAWKFARRFGAYFQVDLIHYSLPYFTEGPDRMLQFTNKDRPAIEKVVKEMECMKRSDPEHFKDSLMGIRSIPDWLIKGPEMRVPCEAYEMVWIGADGSVQLCYVTFPLGNLHQSRLRDLLYTEAHRRAARDAFLLKCPNCHCGRDARVQRDLSSRKLYR